MLAVLGAPDALPGWLYWLGASENAGEGSWAWVTGEDWSYKDWVDPEPNGGDSENHLSLYGLATDGRDDLRFHWNDLRGWAELPYVLEFGYPTDPLNPDSDGDGYNDKLESDAGTDPNNPASSPVPPDTDGDGVNNYREIRDGTDPNDPNSVNPLSKGLVAYYPFDGNPNDESGYSHNARAFNAAFTTGVGGVPDTAVEFDGVSAYLTAMVPVPAEDRFSWAFWVNAGRIDSEAWLLNRVRQVGVNLVEPALVINKYTEGYGREPDASLAFYSFDGSEQKLFTPGQIVPHNMWIHLAATRANDGNTRIYANGRLVAEGSSASLDALETIVLGANGQVPTFFFEGKMDNVRVYDRDLSPADIRTLFVSEAGDLDSDNDGLPDVHETNTGTYVSATDAGTDPYNPDTSGDGIFDGEAVLWKFNPLTDHSQVLAFLRHATGVQSGRFALYTEGSIMDLNLGGVMLQKSGNQASVRFKVESKMDLRDPSWTDRGTYLLPLIDMPGSKGFLRIRAEQP